MHQQHQGLLTLGRASWLNNFNNNSNFNANDRNVNNHARVRGIIQNGAETPFLMVSYHDLWKKLCSFKNLELAFKRARKHKTLKPYVLEFEKDAENNLSLLQTELLLHSYRLKPLQTFIIRDPKTRKISKSHFRDRIVHHALCNVIEPMLEKVFIYDSYANRKRKGTLKAIKRFEFFARKASHNYTRKIFVLKADVRHYFETVDHNFLFSILMKKIADKRVRWLMKVILSNYHSAVPGKGMPLGNLTSQFFANVYLNELDHFVKQQLKAQYYLRYVDDFIIVYHSRQALEEYKQHIDNFLHAKLALELHPDKSKIISLSRGVDFLGFTQFLRHKIIKKKNMLKLYRKSDEVYASYKEEKILYDSIYDFMEGWMAYSKNANMFKVRKRILAGFERRYPREISTKEVNRHLKEQKRSANQLIAEIREKKKPLQLIPNIPNLPPPLLLNSHP